MTEGQGACLWPDCTEPRTNAKALWCWQHKLRAQELREIERIDHDDLLEAAMSAAGMGRLVDHVEAILATKEIPTIGLIELWRDMARPRRQPGPRKVSRGEERQDDPTP